MHVHTPDPADDVTTTPNAVMTRLATPVRGTAEVSAWTVRMDPGSRGPVHAIDREQLWLPVSGAITITSGVPGDAVHRVAPGQVAILPRDEVRQIANDGDGPAELLVCTTAGPAHATLPESGETRIVPWSQ